MLQLLNDLLARKRGRAGNPASIYMRELVRNNMSRVSKRYKDSSRFVRPEHLVVKIINAIGIGRTMSPEDAVFAAEDRMYSIANALGLTAATSFGKPQAHVTLDLGVEAVLLYSADPQRSVPPELFSLSGRWRFADFLPQPPPLFLPRRELPA